MASAEKESALEFSDALAAAVRISPPTAPDQSSDTPRYRESNSSFRGAAEEKSSVASVLLTDTKSGVPTQFVAATAEDEAIQASSRQERPGGASGPQAQPRAQDRQSRAVNTQAGTNLQSIFPMPSKPQNGQLQAVFTSGPLLPDALPRPAANNETRMTSSPQIPATVQARIAPARVSDSEPDSNAPGHATQPETDIEAFHLNLDIAGMLAQSVAPQTNVPAPNSLTPNRSSANAQVTSSAASSEGTPSPNLAPPNIGTKTGETQQAAADRQVAPAQAGERDETEADASRPSGRGSTSQGSPQNLVTQIAAPGQDPAAPVLISKTHTGNSSAATAPVVIENSAPMNSAKEMVMRVEGGRGEVVNVRLTDQGGHIQVAVRTNDPASASLLRQDLSSLTSTLERIMWKPGIAGDAIPSHWVVAEQSSRSESGEAQRDQSGSSLDWDPESERKKYSAPELWDMALEAQNNPATPLSQTLHSR